MYCYHCAKHIDEAKIEAKKSSFAGVEDIQDNAKIAYVCPRCGHLITEGASEEDIKSLSRASHAQLQRARNGIAIGMGFISVGAILGIVGLLFYFLAKKPSNQYQLVLDCAEFYVSVVLAVISIALLSYGAVRFILGLIEKRRNNALLKEINNRTFVQ